MSRPTLDLLGQHRIWYLERTKYFLHKQAQFIFPISCHLPQNNPFRYPRKFSLSQVFQQLRHPVHNSY